ncbi:MAG: hypothetical protein JXA21_11855 [Anaerolineae bacterium]|nr:hypothetical protein [Anaerolineae bacterium]
MPTGASSLYYPEQHKPAFDLALDDSYVLVKLHDAQAFFEAGWLVKPGLLAFSSSVESSFQPDLPTQSLHQITSLQKNIPCRLGLSANLTDWLPARTTDWLRVNLKYTVVQDNPFGELVDQMGKVGLVAKVSLVRPDWAVAVKVSEIVGQLLSYLLREGSQHEIFSLATDLNLANLKTGYYAVIGSHGNESWTKLRMDDNGNLVDKTGNPLSRHSYAVFQVLALPRRDEEIARDEPWWELLQAGREQVSDAMPANDEDRRELLNEWKSTLAQVRTLARKDRKYLLNEIRQIIQAVQVEVEAKLLPSTKGEAYGLEELPEDWQALLGVRTEQELRHSVQDYRDALEASKGLVEQFAIGE